MNQILLLASSLLLATSMAQALPFEGSLSYQIDNGVEQQQISIIIKDSKMAMETPANPEGVVLIDRATMDAKILIPRQKVYLEMPASEFIDNANASPNGNFEVTDETRRILGYTAKKVIYTDGGETSEIWITDELGRFSPLQGPLTDNYAMELLNAFPNGGMPLEMTTTDYRGTVTVRVTEIEPKSVSDAEVEIPEGYSKLAIKGVPLPGVP